MDDPNKNPDENQTPKPIFESIPQDGIVPEEVAPEITSSGEEVVEQQPDVPPPVPPVYEENKTKYAFIAGGAIFFLLVLIFLMRIFFSAAPAKDVKLSYWGLWEEKEIMDPVIQDYQRKTPNVKIDYVKMAPQEYREKLLARSKNGQGPDIFRFHNTWLPEIRELVTAVPQTVMTNAEFEKTFYKIHQKDLKIENNYYGLPMEIDGLVLMYNEDLFKKIGIEAAPSNWDELTEIVNKFSEAVDRSGNPITPGIALGTVSNVAHFSDILGLMLLQNGASLKTLDQPEASDALQSYRKFAETPAKIWNEKMPNSIIAFAQEKVAMIFAPSWQVLTIKTINPELKLKVVPVPSVPGSSPVSLASYWVEGVSRYSKNQTEAWKFIRYLVEKDTLTKLHETQSKKRLFGEPYSRVDLAPLLAQHEFLGPVIRQAPNFSSIYGASRTYDNGLNDEINQYFENAVNSTIQGVSYREAMITANNGIKQVLEKYKIQ